MTIIAQKTKYMYQQKTLQKEFMFSFFFTTFIPDISATFGELEPITGL